LLLVADERDFGAREPDAVLLALGRLVVSLLIGGEAGLLADLGLNNFIQVVGVLLHKLEHLGLSNIAFYHSFVR